MLRYPVSPQTRQNCDAKRSDLEGEQKNRRSECVEEWLDVRKACTPCRSLGFPNSGDWWLLVQCPLLLVGQTGALHHSSHKSGNSMRDLGTFCSDHSSHRPWICSVLSLPSCSATSMSLECRCSSSSDITSTRRFLLKCQCSGLAFIILAVGFYYNTTVFCKDCWCKLS